MAEFVAWPKTPRWNREVIITEKIDGTNACVVIEPGLPSESQEGYCAGVLVGDDFFKVAAQSRKRIIVPGTDNYGFAAWVRANAETLVRDLGTGRHYGEWYGSGIQRGYGLDHKRFALFNTKKWADTEFETEHLGCVPVLLTLDSPDQFAIDNTLECLRSWGSLAVPGYDKPEGLVLFHTAANQVFKVLLDNDAGHKGE